MIAGLLLVVGLVMVLCALRQAPARSTILALLGVAATLVGVVGLVAGLRPFRFRIGADGLDLKVNRINRLVPWAEIDAIILDQPMPDGSGRKPALQLLLVPAAGSTLEVRAGLRSPVDERPGLVVLKLDQVRDVPDDVAEALVRHGGDRFTDARHLHHGRASLHDFTVVLRGYDIASVNELVRRSQQALASGTAAQRIVARATIEANPLPVGMRGYDRTEVDAFLTALLAELAEKQPDGEPEPD